VLVEEGKTVREVTNGGWDPRIRVFECDKMVRAFAVYSKRLTVVIDTLLGPAAGRWLHDAVAERLQSPMIVVNSHADWDHYWGNQAFATPIVGSRLSVKRVLETHGPLEVEKKRKDDGASYADVVPTPPSVLIEGHGELHGGDLTFQLIPTPGHRPDQLSVWIPELRTLFPGDSVEDPFPLLDDSKDGDLARQALHSLSLQIALGPDWVMACHAEPQQGHALLESNASYLRKLLDTARQVRSGPECDQQMLALFPYPGPAGDSFYIDEHLRNLQQALLEA
jgi:glyoxylase-like metal-dependent hydrolase (beta-lactamase superfamily II)